MQVRGLDSEHAWYASEHEGAWHAAPVNARGRYIKYLCAHIARGPFHRRLEEPEPDDKRSVCHACKNTLAEEPTQKFYTRFFDQDFVNAQGAIASAINWPSEYPDSDSRQAA